ncbi:MAG: rRNA maturation RNase YbeY [Bacteroidales bacterium]
MDNPTQVDFHFLDVEWPGFPEGKARQWLIDVIVREGAVPGELSIIFCDDAYLLQLNQSFLDHDTLTDVITFPYVDDFDGLSGDVFISLPRVRENARAFEVDDTQELFRVMIHGVLHLLGYDDADASARETMRAKENYYLSLLS